MLGKQFLSRVILTAALGGGLLLSSAAIPALADRDWTNDCHKRLADAKARLDHDAARYGDHNPRVDRDRDRLEDARKWCRDHHADWDHNTFDVGIYIR